MQLFFKILDAAVFYDYAFAFQDFYFLACAGSKPSNEAVAVYDSVAGDLWSVRVGVHRVSDCPVSFRF